MEILNCLEFVYRKEINSISQKIFTVRLIKMIGTIQSALEVDHQIFVSWEEETV